MVEAIRVPRRNSTIKGSNAITIKNRVILLTSDGVRKCQERRMKLKWHKMSVIVLTMYC